MIWEEQRWIIVAALAIFLFILLDELAYYWWKQVNPGALYSHLFSKGHTPLVDPTRPPTVYYE